MIPMVNRSVFISGCCLRDARFIAALLCQHGPGDARQLVSKGRGQNVRMQAPSGTNEPGSEATKAAEGLAAACPKDLPKTSGERLAFMEKRMEAMLQAVKIVRPAFDAFYASLNEGQKASLDEAGPRRWGWQRWRDR